MPAEKLDLREGTKMKDNTSKTDSRRVFNPLTNETLYEVEKKLDTIEKIDAILGGCKVSDIGYLTYVMKQ